MSEEKEVKVKKFNPQATAEEAVKGAKDKGWVTLALQPVQADAFALNSVWAVGGGRGYVVSALLPQADGSTHVVLQKIGIDA